MNNSRNTVSPEEQLLRRRALEVAAELKARQALKDCFFWMTECTKTVDEQSENPYKPFPREWYIKALVDVLANEDVVLIEKSRSVMGSWTVAAYCAWRAFNCPATRVLFQSKDEDRSINLIHYVKTLWEQSLPQLQLRWPVRRHPREQAYSEFELANGSVFKGVVGHPDKVRSEHPTIYVADESAFMPEFEDAWAVAAGSRVPKMIALSTVELGGFYELCNQDSDWCDWPDYGRAAA